MILLPCNGQDINDLVLRFRKPTVSFEDMVAELEQLFFASCGIGTTSMVDFFNETLATDVLNQSFEEIKFAAHSLPT